VKAVFLCGGSSKRMSPLTEDKFLLDFLGKPLLQYQMETARKAVLNDFVVVGNPKSMDKIEAVTKKLSGIRVELALQEQPVGIANALECAKPYLDGETLVVNPNDIIESSAYTAIIREAKNGVASSYLLGYKVEGYFPGGYLVVDSNGCLKHIVEKPKYGEQPSNLVNILVHFHHDPKRLLEYTKRANSAKDDIYECALESMVKDGYPIKVVPYAGSWHPIKYPWHIFNAVRYFLDRAEPYVSPSAEVSRQAIIEGKVILSDRVKVLENAVIRGPVYIGPNSIIGNNVLVRDHSCIGADCVIGYSTEIKNSYIRAGCWFHSNYIGDSIIGEGCSLGAGTVLANWRFDERNILVKIGDEVIDTGRNKLGAIIGNNCKTGINAGIMPGIRVGANCIIGPNVCLTRDLEPDKIVKAATRYRTLSRDVINFNSENQQKLMKEPGERGCAE